MFIKLASVYDAPVVYELMIKAFTTYKDDKFPSSALDETVESIEGAMKKGEQAFICYKEMTPVGMIRFQAGETNVYFYRLSVIPSEQRKGIAKKLVIHLEKYAKEKGVTYIYCKVRQSEEQNIMLYHSIGYKVFSTSVVEHRHGKLKIVSMKKQLEII